MEGRFSGVGHLLRMGYGFYTRFRTEFQAEHLPPDPIYIAGRTRNPGGDDVRSPAGVLQNFKTDSLRRLLQV